MENNTFSYNYSAVRNKEVESIRRKYMPREESKLETYGLPRFIYAIATVEKPPRIKRLSSYRIALLQMRYILQAG